MCITSLPTIANTFVFTEPGWWSNPASSTSYTELVPAWWLNTHPVMYYFIGCYLREHRLSLSKFKCFFILIGTLLTASAYNYYRSHGTIFQAGKWTDWESPFTILLTVMVYILLTDVKKFKDLSPKTKSVLKYLSELTLGAYLVSYIFIANFIQNLPLQYLICLTDFRIILSWYRLCLSAQCFFLQHWIWFMKHCV